MKPRVKMFSNSVINILAIFFLFPLMTIVLWNFIKIWPWPDIIPTEFSLRSIESIISIKILKIIFTSILISIIVTIITIGISIPASKALGLYEFKGKNIFEIIILSPLIVPCLCVSMGIHYIFIRMGIANTYIGVILIHIFPSIPYAVRIITSGYKMMGEEFELQSRILGANKVKTFLFVSLPILMPSIVAASTIVFIISYSQYFMTFLIGGGRVITLPIIMFPYIQSGDRQLGSIYSLVFILSSLIVIYAIESFLKSRYKKH